MFQPLWPEKGMCVGEGDVVCSVQMWTRERNWPHNDSLILMVFLCDFVLNFATSIFIYSLFSLQGVHVVNSRAPYATGSVPPL